MARSEPAWKVWQGRAKKSRRRLTPEQISWPLTRDSGLELPEQQLVPLRRTLTEPEPTFEVLHNAKRFSSFPNPPPSVHLAPLTVAPSHCFESPALSAPATSTTFPDPYPTPPPSARFPPTDVRDALQLICYEPLSPPGSLPEPPKFKCTLIRRNARRDTARRRSSGDAMATDLLSPRLNGARAKQAEAAHEMQSAVEHHAERSGVAAPAYDFLELIGKGAFGRVYKGKQRETNELVAIKICEIDKADYTESSPTHRDETIKQLVKETSILQQLRDSSAGNVNKFYASFAFHSQLWMITEYVAGGSVRTLMRATPGGTPQRPMPLEEHFIIPIAREVAKGLKSVHDAGILHRDIKCANVMISEKGHVQLIDFGVSGLLETTFDKRSTIIGTPNWMPPEMIKDQVGAGYGTEVDCWAFGCTVYEMATGLPPDAGRNFEFLANRRQAPRLEGNQYSNGLRDFVSFILKERPYERPSVAEVLEHHYIYGTHESFPNKSLSELVKRFLDWQDRGGNRSSLWAAGGAEGLDPSDPSSDGGEDWVFSTTAEFERDFAYEKRLSTVDPFRDGRETRTDTEDDGMAPKGRGRKFMMHQKAMKEQQVKRGGEAMDRLFNLQAPEYKYGEEPPIFQTEDFDASSQSDLALRNWEPNRASNRVTMIDLDDAAGGLDATPNLDLANASTLRASRINRIMKDLEDDDDEEYTYQPNRGSKRATKDWKFPMMEPPPEKRATKDWKFPMMEPPPQETARRSTKDWKFPMMEPPPIPEDDPKTEDTKNRRTMDWTFATAEVSEDEGDPAYRTSRLVQRRGTKELQLPAIAAKSNNNRNSGLPGFSFPMGPAGGSSVSDKGPRASLGPSPPLGDSWKPQLRHAATQPVGHDDFFFSQSAPGSPERTSMIDLDFADLSFVPRPPTATSMVDSFTSSIDADITTGNPFDLEEQAQLSQNNDRASYHRQSQSEPHKRISGLLTPGDQEEDDDEKAQGYVSDHGPVVEGREEQHRVSIGSRKSSLARDSNGSLAHRLINPRRRTKGSDSKKADDGSFALFSGNTAYALPDGAALNDETIKSRRQISNTSVPSFNPESPRTWRYQDSLLSSTPPSTNGSFSSSTFASPDTALAYHDDISQLTTPRTSIATYSPRSAASFSMQLGAVQQRQRMPLRIARPTPPHPPALDNSADPRLLVFEGSRVARDHVLYLKTLRRTLKACGSQAQARRAGRKPRNGSMNGTDSLTHSAATSVSLSSTDTSDVEGAGGTAKRVLRRAESSLA